MVKKITTLISENKKALTRKALIVGGVALGLIAGALLTKPEEETILIVGETVDDEKTTEDPKPES